MDVEDTEEGTIIVEGGEMGCSHWSLSLSGSAVSSTEFTVSGKLMTHTDTGMIIIGIRATDPVTPSALGSMITSLMLDMDSILLDSTSKGDDE